MPSSIAIRFHCHLIEPGEVNAFSHLRRQQQQKKKANYVTIFVLVQLRSSTVYVNQEVCI